MKRSEIKAGAELYYNRHRNWEVYGGGDRVVVVDEGRYKPRSWVPRGESPWEEDPAGTHVLVDVYLPHRDSVKPHRRVVPLAHLRGDWTQCKQRVQELYQRRERERKADKVRQQAIYERAVALQQRAAQLGITVYKGDHDTLSMSSQALEQVLDVMESVVGGGK